MEPRESEGVGDDGYIRAYSRRALPVPEVPRARALPGRENPGSRGEASIGARFGSPGGLTFKVRGSARLHRAASLLTEGFGHAVHEEDSGSEQPAPGNARKRFAHDFAGDRRIVVGLSPKPPAVTEPKVPTQP